MSKPPLTASEMIKTTKEANAALNKEWRQTLRDWLEDWGKAVLVALKEEDENRPS